MPLAIQRVKVVASFRRHTSVQGRPGGREQPGGAAGKISWLTCFGPCQCLLMTRSFNPLVARWNLVEPARIQALQL